MVGTLASVEKLFAVEKVFLQMVTQAFVLRICGGMYY